MDAGQKELCMLRRSAYVRLMIAFAYTAVTSFTTSVYGKSPEQPANPNKDIGAVQVPETIFSF
jgi:hypothetical protein